MATLTWINVISVVPCERNSSDYDVYYKSDTNELYEQFVHLDRDGTDKGKGPIQNCYHATQRAINWVCLRNSVDRSQVKISFTPGYDSAFIGFVPTGDTVVSPQPAPAPTYRIAAETSQGTNFYPDTEYTTQFAALRACIDLVEAAHNTLYGAVTEAYVIPATGNSGYWDRLAGARRNEDNIWDRHVYVLQTQDDVPF
jgi:N-methylhydantoinase B/oxoprolinase/acetone carboxylase alpha subunit